MKNKDKIKATESQMIKSIMKSLYIADEAINKIENPSELQETPKQSSRHSEANDLDFHKKALRSHDQFGNKSTDVNFVLGSNDFNLDTNER